MNTKNRENSQDVYEQIGVAMTCRAFWEYESMFVLDHSLLSAGRILDVAGGAASFSATARERGYDTYAVDPLYELNADDIYHYGKEEIINSTAKLAQIAHTFNWEPYGNLENHQKNREESLDLFHKDFIHHHHRYFKGLLPTLPFENEEFSLILCSHFLFLYHQQFDYDFHKKAISELIRICRSGGEIRIYPLIVLNREPYPYLQQIIKELSNENLIIEQIDTSFTFLEGANKVLRIYKMPSR